MLGWNVYVCVCFVCGIARFTNGAHRTTPTKRFYFTRKEAIQKNDIKKSD